MLRRNGLRTGQYMHAGRWGDAATVNRDAVYAAPRPPDHSHDRRVAQNSRARRVIRSLEIGRPEAPPPCQRPRLRVREGAYGSALTAAMSAAVVAFMAACLRVR